ncbi:MAG: pilus assembly protein TadG-related protein [Actinomycetota bacterium]
MGEDRGQAMPWLLLVMLMAMVVVAFGARLGAVVDDAAQARTAADAAALAGAVAGEQEARALAEVNGGELVAFRRTPDGVEVVVQVGDARARAEAVSSSSWQPVGGPD